MFECTILSVVVLEYRFLSAKIEYRLKLKQTREKKRCLKYQTKKRRKKEENEKIGLIIIFVM